MKNWTKRIVLVMLMPLALTACVTTTISAAKSSCAELVPKEWDKPIEDAPAPKQGDTALDTLKSWIGFGTAQTGRKRLEYERAKASRDIVANCIARDQEAIEKSKPKFLGLF